MSKNPRKLTKQTGLSQYFRDAPESIETNNSGQKKCKCYHKWFILLGYSTHMNYHISHGQKVLPRGLPKFCRVKFRDGTKARKVTVSDDHVIITIAQSNPLSTGNLISIFAGDSLNIVSINESNQGIEKNKLDFLTY